MMIRSIQKNASTFFRNYNFQRKYTLFNKINDIVINENNFSENKKTLLNNNINRLEKDLFSVDLINGRVYLHLPFEEGKTSKKRETLVKIYSLIKTKILQNPNICVKELKKLCDKHRLKVNSGDLKRSLMNKKSFLFEKNKFSLSDEGIKEAILELNKLSAFDLSEPKGRANDVIFIMNKEKLVNKPVKVSDLAKICTHYGYKVSTTDLRKAVFSFNSQQYFIILENDYLTLSPLGKKIYDRISFLNSSNEGIKKKSLKNSDNYSVYKCFSNEEPSYIGITKKIKRRKKEHHRNNRDQLVPIEHLNQLTKNEARVIEQALIDFHGLKKNGGRLRNKINSIKRRLI
ncbi:hypothetical protein [Candidatus Neptunichlamydia sp. REUL1]|uniref:hypothetical protein n=1 Tax=Candidatus Neptunichlamydia sp. REUL1 TaxID=3064277 RepID=UPI002930CDDD|nr:hypothetical protein [Candidatus Neptunochlamydia sp. REUL1]